MEVMLVLSLLCEGKAEDQLAYCFQVCVSMMHAANILILTMCRVACCSCLMLMAVTLW